jgi:hypothetical protein
MPQRPFTQLALAGEKMFWFVHITPYGGKISSRSFQGGKGGCEVDKELILYLCPVCFQACDSEIECHAHRMLQCHVGQPGDERRKPVRDRSGNYVSRAPRWFLEAVWSIQPGRQ